MDPNYGQGLQGAAGGAMAGSLFGPGGMAIGGLLGGLGGLFGGGGASDYQDQLKQLANQYGSRKAPGAETAQAGDSAFRQNQAGLIAQLEAMGRGEGPSAASKLMQQAMDRAAAGQASAAAGAGGRGVNAGAALRNAANNTAATQMQGARDTATLRAQEQLGALGQLGGVVQGARGQDLGLNTFNAGQQNQMNLANLQAIMQQQQLNQSGQLQALGMGMQGAGPGLGASLLAGGGSMMPGILQYLGAQGKAIPGGEGSPTSFFNWGQSGTQYT